MSTRRWVIVAGVGAATVALTLGVALTRGDGATASAAETASLTAYVANNSDTDTADGTDPRAQIRDLMTNEDFRDDVAALRDTHEAAMDEWWDTHGEDPDSDAAREARESLREQQRTQMNALLEKYGVDTSAMEEAHETAQQAREKLQDLMADDQFRADLDEVRDAQQTAMEKWWDSYGEDPTSDKAREAMQKLREDARADMEKLLEKYDVELPDGRGGGVFGGRGGDMMGPDGFGGGMGPMERGGGMGGDCEPPVDDGSGSDAQDGATTLSL